MWPEKGKDDLLSHFLDYAPEGEVKDGRFYIMASWADNPYLKEEEREHLRKSVPAWQLEAREHGIPVFGQGKVFTMKESELFVEPFQIPKHFALVYGLDPSSSSGGTWGCVLLAHDRDRDMFMLWRITNSVMQRPQNMRTTFSALFLTGVQAWLIPQEQVRICTPRKRRWIFSRQDRACVW
jgi:hypothetical protein